MPVVGQEPNGMVTPTALVERVRNRLMAAEPAAAFREVVQFVDDLTAVDPEVGCDAVEEEPSTTGDLRWDALIAAAVDWVSSARDWPGPAWTSGARWKLDAPGWVVSPYEQLHPLIREQTPEEFARHGVYVDRVIDYELDDGRGETGPYRLFTTLLDPAEAAAEDLAYAYAQRWEIELVFDELKTHQRGPRAVLRSKSPALIEQEIWGYLWCHYAIRTLMFEAAHDARVDPEQRRWPAA
jgi:hypothetical protein